MDFGGIMQEIVVEGNLSWGNVAIVVTILISIWALMTLKAKWAREGQKKQAKSEIEAMPFFSAGVVSLPTATDPIEANIIGFHGEDLVHLESEGYNHYIAVKQFASGCLGNRFDVLKN